MWLCCLRGSKAVPGYFLGREESGHVGEVSFGSEYMRFCLRRYFGAMFEICYNKFVSSPPPDSNILIPRRRFVPFRVAVKLDSWKVE